MINNKFNVVHTISNLKYYNNMNINKIFLIKYLIWLYTHNYNYRETRTIGYFYLDLWCIISKQVVLQNSIAHCFVSYNDYYNNRYIVNNNVFVLSHYMVSILDYVICITH